LASFFTTKFQGTYPEKMRSWSWLCITNPSEKEYGRNFNDMHSSYKQDEDLKGRVVLASFH